MNRKFKENVVPEIARARGLEDIGPDWDLASVWPLLEQVREDGAVLLLKLDGQRSRNPYTAVLSGGRLSPENNVIHVDSSSMERYAQAKDAPRELSLVLGSCWRQLWLRRDCQV